MAALLGCRIITQTPQAKRLTISKVLSLSLGVLQRRLMRSSLNFERDQMHIFGRGDSFLMIEYRSNLVSSVLGKGTKLNAYL